MGKVLVTDDLDRCALELLGQSLDVEACPGLSHDQLLRAVSEADALIVRSSTQVTREVIAAGHQLKVIGRAGAGIDNIDVEAATLRGIWVVNAPDANSTAVAEHVFALMLALARRVPWAWQSLARGEWHRGRFRGEELAGKRLGIIGLGRTGSGVAERGRAFRMEVRAHDPFVAPDHARSLGVELVSLRQLLAESDFITLHVPALPTTEGLLGEAELRLCQPTAYVINCSRGAVVDETALLRALDEGRLAGAGLDVFSREPPGDSPLVRHPKVIATPHIAGMTREAQANVALAVAEQVMAVLEGRRPSHPVNAPSLSPEQQARIGPYLDLARRLGQLYAAIADQPTASVQVECRGQAVDMETSMLSAAALEGMLTGASETPVNLINARHLAHRRGIAVTETTATQSSPYSSLVTLAVEAGGRVYRLAGTIMHGQPYVVRIQDFPISFIPAGSLLYTEHIEQPGILGGMGTLLGELGVNISFVQVGRQSRGGPGVMILGIDDTIDQGALQAVHDLPSVLRARLVELPPVET